MLEYLFLKRSCFGKKQRRTCFQNYFFLYNERQVSKIISHSWTQRVSLKALSDITGILTIFREALVRALLVMFALGKSLAIVFVI